MQKYPLERVLAFVVVLWGICLFGIAASNNFRESKLNTAEGVDIG